MCVCLDQVSLIDFVCCWQVIVVVLLGCVCDKEYCIFWRIRLLFNPGKSSQKSGVVLYAGWRICRVYLKLYILTGKVGGRLIRPVLYAGKYGKHETKLYNVATLNIGIYGN